MGGVAEVEEVEVEVGMVAAGWAPL